MNLNLGQVFMKSTKILTMLLFQMQIEDWIRWVNFFVLIFFLLTVIWMFFFFWKKSKLVCCCQCSTWILLGRYWLSTTLWTCGRLVRWRRLFRWSLVQWWSSSTTSNFFSFQNSVFAFAFSHLFFFLKNKNRNQITNNVSWLI